jgi:hypothetical protein
MTRWRAVAATLAALAAGAGTARAQASRLLTEGIKAYGDLDLDLAVRLLRAEAARLGVKRTASDERSTALVYLGATELLRGKRDSATAAFRELVSVDPRFRPDRLIFPPQVTTLFEQVRQATKTVVVVAPGDTEIALGGGGGSFAAWVIPTSPQRVDVTLRHADGAPFRGLYTGAVNDSILVRWNGLDAAGKPPPPTADRLLLRIASFASSGEVAGVVQLPLGLKLTEGDTLSWSNEPPDSLLLPERAGKGPAGRALLGGAVVSAAVVVLPSIVGGTDASSGPRVVVAGTVGIASLVGYFVHRAGRPVPGNILANQRTRAAWQQRMAAAQAENERRHRAARLAIHVGEPIVVEARRP